jgi:hypothetical protein
MKKKISKTRTNRAKKMSSKALRNFVLREAAKLTGNLTAVEDTAAEEVDADDYANTLEQDLDIYKAMKIKEVKMRRQYRKLVREAKKVRRNKMLAKKKILRKLK